ncbi:ankyrin repeat domain-containing protein [Shouchella patagoniensis]|uniref:ankyrin repeat domain-containing protein n=1 Tax=Shouchella patagoniensis TaxID=228576 RepID=UPI0009951FF7|nr:ankyrin repeat domain-containing protein [Shouchella patagoniensis]
MGSIYGAVVFALVAGSVVIGSMIETVDTLMEDVFFGYEQGWEDDGSDLFHAVINDDTEEVRQLLATNEFDINETDYVGDSLLYYAVSNLNYELVELLLKEGADPNEYYYDESPLVRSLYNDGYKTALLLLEYDADPAYTDSFGDSAYEMMSVDNEEELIAELEWHLQ